jgi:hydroxymethylpyrimidine/phosphomethylpyrimidine kinase
MSAGRAAGDALHAPVGRGPPKRSTPMQSNRPVPPLVMTFAGTDPTSGAGIQADLMAIASLGCHPLSVVTALTVQDSERVANLLAVDAEWVEDQARQVLEDMRVAAFKVGVIGSVENVAAIAEVVSDYPDVPLVLDPVLAAGNGDELAGDELIAAIRELLLPQTTVLTPNSLEARRLVAADLAAEDPALDDCAFRLLTLGCEYVLVTGTHEPGSHVVNSLYGPVTRATDDDAEEDDQVTVGLVRSDAWTRLPGSYHGSGCTLASAVAAMLANGQDVATAVREAQEYTWNALRHGFRPGMGQYIPDRFFWARQTGDAS